MWEGGHLLIVMDSHEVVFGDVILCHLQALVTGVRGAIVGGIISFMQLAYVASAVLILGMIALYLNAIVHDKKTVTAICLFMGLVDVFIYILLSIADMALLVGTFGLFVILGVAMFFSLKIKFQSKPTPAPVEVKDNVSETEEI